jgi:hypothetical protein
MHNNIDNLFGFIDEPLNNNFNIILPSLWEKNQLNNNKEFTPQSSSLFLNTPHAEVNKLPQRMDPINYILDTHTLPLGFVRSFFKIDNPNDYGRIVGKNYSRANFCASYIKNSRVSNVPNHRNVLMIITNDFASLQWLENKLFEILKEPSRESQPTCNSISIWQKANPIQKNRIYFYWDRKNSINSKDEIKKLFETFGKVTNIKIFYQKDINKFKNYGWITYESSESAKNAVTINNLPNITIEYANN